MNAIEIGLTIDSEVALMVLSGLVTTCKSNFDKNSADRALNMVFDCMKAYTDRPIFDCVKTLLSSQLKFTLPVKLPKPLIVKMMQSNDELLCVRTVELLSSVLLVDKMEKNAQIKREWKKFFDDTLFVLFQRLLNDAPPGMSRAKESVEVFLPKIISFID